MANDIQLIEGEFGSPVSFEILDENGDSDDLTVYTTVRFVISQMDYSANLRNHVQTDNEIDTSLFSSGILRYTPTSTNPVPAFGHYWIQIFRELATVNKPVRKFSLLVTREATKV